MKGINLGFFRKILAIFYFVTLALSAFEQFFYRISSFTIFKGDNRPAIMVLDDKFREYLQSLPLSLTLSILAIYILGYIFVYPVFKEYISKIKNH